MSGKDTKLKCPECGSLNIYIDDIVTDGEPNEGNIVLMAHCIQKEWYNEHWFRIKFDLINPKIE